MRRLSTTVLTAALLTLGAGGVGLSPLARADVTFEEAQGAGRVPASSSGDRPTEPTPVPIPAKAPASIELAILLDTSNSMDGLIDQARTRIWSIVNTMTRVRMGGAPTRLRVALYEYGNSGLAREGGWIRQVTPLTDDLDRLSQDLFSLRTNGGDEFCGQVIRRAVSEIAWSADGAFRTIVIAGNEPFSQGSVPYQEACREAVAKGIVINTIHCGDAAQGRAGGWVDGARLGEGECINIDQNAEAAQIPTPYDEALGKLSQSLNGTYIGYGREGETRGAVQRAQDAEAAKAAPSAAAERAVAKGGGNYRNSTWDLVDAEDEKTVDVTKIDAKDLPPEMQGMTPEQRKAFVEGKRADRKRIQEEIGKVNQQREAFLAEARKKQASAGASAGASTFESAVNDALSKQLAKRGFTAGQ